MDFSRFNDEGFDHKEWINQLVETSSDNFEELTDIVIKLQYCMQEVNTLIDEGTHSAFQCLPRAMREIEGIRQEAAELQEQMNLVKPDIEKVEQSTQDSMRNLLKLSTQKQKLVQVERALREAGSWTDICGSMDSVIQSGDVAKICEKIVMLQNCLTMLTAAPDLEKRHERVQQLCNNLESQLGPVLIQAYFSHDRDQIQHCLELFDRVGRADCGIKYYSAWFKPTVTKMWQDSKGGQKWNTNDELLRIFYEQLFHFISDELSGQCGLTRVREMVLGCLTDSLASLEPEFDAVVSQQCQDLPQGVQRMEFLAGIMQVIDDFSIRLEDRLLEIDSDEETPEHTVEHLAVTLYRQLKGVDDVFGTECQHFCQHRLNSIKMDVTEASESIDVLDQSVQEVMNLASEAVRYCQRVCHFTALESSIVTVIKELFSNYSREFKRVATNIILKLDSANSVATSATSASVGRDSSLAGDLINGDSCMDQYFFLQDGIRLTAVGGHVSVKFNQFLVDMMIQIGNHVSHLLEEKINKRSMFLRRYPETLMESVQQRRRVLEHWQRLASNTQQKQAAPNETTLLRQLEVTRRELNTGLLQWLNRAVYERVLQPVKVGLTSLGQSSIWTDQPDSGHALPQYAYSPQEYITKIGQFFMTLPQQLEPLLGILSGAETAEHYLASVRDGALPHCQASSLSSGDESSGVQVAHMWLDSIVAGALDSLLQQWTGLHHLTRPGAQQLLSDIAYIVGLVDDLGLSVPIEMKNMTKMLQVATGNTPDDRSGPPDFQSESSARLTSFSKVVASIGS